MEKEVIVAKKPKKYFKSKCGNKFALVKAKYKDCSDWIYTYNQNGEYQGCANFFSGGYNLIQISEVEFLFS
jgi:hypothetical protein